MEKRLAEREWLVSEKYTIADIMWYTWMRTAPGILGMDIPEFPNVVEWIGRISERDAVKRAFSDS